MMSDLIQQIHKFAYELGFQQVGIADVDLSEYEEKFLKWLSLGFHGEMDFMQKHGLKRTRPEALIPGTISLISVRMDYLPPDTSALTILNNPQKGYISRYALGRDYHKLMRKRLALLAKKIESLISPFGYRVFTDSAPALEKAIAEKAGLGWIGKHTNLINSKAGSWFFLGEIFTDLPLPTQTKKNKTHCGSCTACIDVCPTKAIVAPYLLDARRCISYLTIELKSTIPVEFRKLIGNRIYGCDDCQLFCPWNKFAKHTKEKDFYPRKDLSAPNLLDLFTWSEQEFLNRTEGSAIRRIGYDAWLRNIAIALGNAPSSPEVIHALQAKLNQTTPMVKDHIEWAIQQHLTLNV